MDAYLIDAVRTPFGKHRGGLAAIRTDDLAALPITELLKRHPGLDPATIDDVLLGDLVLVTDAEPERLTTFSDSF